MGTVSYGLRASFIDDKGTQRLVCGIAGIVAVAGRLSDPVAAERMANAIAHRGPDAKGHWVSADGRVVLAHRRLAVIDLDERARQPMIGSDGRTVIAYNGEIYNHADLRRQLRSAGHAFRTASSDTEVLLEGYRAWGLDGLLSRVDGIFAFALHDGAADVTHLVRDRYGIKPLYVAWRDDGHGGAEILFASEVRAITAHPKVRARIDWRQVARYLTFLSVPAPATMLQGIWKVPAGCRVAVTADGRATIARFHEAAEASVRSAQPRPRDTLVADLRATFARVVDSQLVADVPVSVMLSGGLDSGAILAQASRRHRGLDAFTVAFVDDPDGDETALAAETARHCGARHHVLRLTSDDATDRIDDVIVAMDEPQADWVCVPLWFLAREVAARGTKVILVGEGADELFVGYEHWRRYLGWIARWAKIAGACAPLALAAAKALAAVSRCRVRWRTRADFLFRAARREELFWGGAVLCWPTVLNGLWTAPVSGAAAVEQPRWIGGDAVVGPSPAAAPAACVRHWYEQIATSDPGADPVARMIALEFRQRLPELLLMRVDKMTMAHGVEARVPFLARAMVDFAQSVPSAEKLAGHRTKALLREAFADLLPAAVLSARKRGFGAPVDRWLRGPFGDRLASEIFAGPLADGLAVDCLRQMLREHRAGRANHAGILWASFVLSRWLRLCDVQSGVG